MPQVEIPKQCTFRTRSSIRLTTFFITPGGERGRRVGVEVGGGGGGGGEGGGGGTINQGDVSKSFDTNLKKKFSQVK